MGKQIRSTRAVSLPVSGSIAVTATNDDNCIVLVRSSQATTGISVTVALPPLPSSGQTLTVAVLPTAHPPNITLSCPRNLLSLANDNLYPTAAMTVGLTHFTFTYGQVPNFTLSGSCTVTWNGSRSWTMVDNSLMFSNYNIRVGDSVVLTNGATVSSPMPIYAISGSTLTLGGSVAQAPNPGTNTYQINYTAGIWFQTN